MPNSTKPNASEPNLTTTADNTPNGKAAVLYYVLATVLLGIDQLTKIAFEKWLVIEGNSVSVIEPVLNWTLAYNRGAAFSFLAGAGGWQKWFFAILGAAVSLFIIHYLYKVPRSARLLSLGLAGVLGGAIGNVVDRLLYGHVIDFIHVHYADVWHYPVFNVADIGICVGMVLIVIDMLFFEKQRVAAAEIK